MTAATMTTYPHEQTLDAVLRPVHNAWVAEARRSLEPALEPGADFWARWDAVRYLFEDFSERYRLERILVDKLCPLLRPDLGQRLQREGDRLFRLRLELDRIGRRRATAAEMAAGTRDLLERLGLWCAEIELATAEIPGRALPADALELLAGLEAKVPAACPPRTVPPRLHEACARRPAGR
jgi:hypothetical protein